MVGTPTLFFESYLVYHYVPLNGTAVPLCTAVYCSPLNHLPLLTIQVQASSKNIMMPSLDHDPPPPPQAAGNHKHLPYIIRSAIRRRLLQHIALIIAY